MKSDINGKKRTVITDIDGKASTGLLQFPILIETNHLSYAPYIATINKVQDSPIGLIPASHIMENVVVASDQYQNVAINPALFIVDEIDRQEIEELGGNNLADVLNYQLNVTITPDASTGRSTVSMFGLSGEYVKILIDNVPMVSDNGAGNNIDITQINLENVEKVEIAEGSMGVMYGSNAVAGVINIITKKETESKWNIGASLQEETIGSEYNFQDRGRHIQTVSLANNISKDLFASVQYTQNDFQGFFNTYQGENYSGTDNLRGYEWNPKDQHSLNGLINYQLSPKVSAFYKYERYQDELNIYGHAVSGRLGVDGEPDYTANDELFKTIRDSHHLNWSGYISESLNFNALISYQKQSRKYEDYTYNIDYQAKVSSRGEITNQSSEVLFSKGLLSGILSNSEFTDLTVGYEIEHQNGYDAVASGDHSSNTSIQHLKYHDLFITPKLSPSSALTIIPGLRWNNNSRYGNHLIWSLSSSYHFEKNFSTKLVVGSAYKTPTFSQLFRYFVDANHDVRGNSNLTPEDGISILFDLTKKYKIGSVELKQSINGYHFNIQDKIMLNQVMEENDGQTTTRFTYLNINKYKTLGFSSSINLSYKKINAMIGGNYIGVKQNIANEKPDGYFYSLALNSRFNYLIPKYDLNFSVNLKYNGSRQQYIDGDDGVSKVNIDPYTLIDTSIKKSFFGKSLETTLGIRNIANIVSANTTGQPSSGHDGQPDTSLLFAYGRSYFLKLAYKLNF
ncbi:TonB-dependent receptor plug domain-containing protein [Reichenbachiella sp. MALMAid0571]